MKQVPLTQGKVALVDDEDFEKVSRLRWHAHRDPDTGTWYARHSYVHPDADGVKRRTSKRGCLQMHRFVLGLCAGIKVDHRNRDGLNNQKHNLRVANDSENQGNRWPNRKKRVPFKGVFFNQRNRRWTSQIAHKWLGSFTTPKDAAIAYDEAAIQRWGDFARTNSSMGLLND